MTTGTVPARGSKVLISADDLRALTAGIFESRGVGPADAAAVADSLVWANLRGVDSHGVSRVPRYVELFDKGVSVPDATVTVQRPRAAVAIVDAHAALGPVAMNRGADEAVAGARDCGIGWASVRGTVYTGSIGYYTSRVAASGMAALGVVAGMPNMAYAGARGAAVATGPSRARPAGHGDVGDSARPDRRVQGGRQAAAAGRRRDRRRRAHDRSGPGLPPPPAWRGEGVGHEPGVRAACQRPGREPDRARLPRGLEGGPTAPPERLHPRDRRVGLPAAGGVHRDRGRDRGRDQGAPALCRGGRGAGARGARPSLRSRPPPNRRAAGAQGLARADQPRRSTWRTRSGPSWGVGLGNRRSGSRARACRQADSSVPRVDSMCVLYA